ncbi:MAG: hypothetical protein HYY91_00225 [Candidatus Omnitrophica bacterium]|nr:hypothetical protein [Candidatus Omnitrophota bacterium]
MERLSVTERVCLALIAPFASALLLYGGWVIVAVVSGRGLELGEIQLGFLSLLVGVSLLACLAALLWYDRPRDQ